MGELTFDGIQFYINGKPLKDGVPPCGRITTSSPMYGERIAKLKSEMDAMAEKYKPIADKLVQEIYESFAPTPLSEDTAQRLGKAFKDLRKTMSNFPPPFTNPTTHKPRKYYKPKFTL